MPSPWLHKGCVTRHCFTSKQSNGRWPKFDKTGLFSGARRLVAAILICRKQSLVFDPKLRRRKKRHENGRTVHDVCKRTTQGHTTNIDMGRMPTSGLIGRQVHHLGMVPCTGCVYICLHGVMPRQQSSRANKNDKYAGQVTQDVFQ